MIYKYKKSASPNLDSVHYNIFISNMENKNLVFCRWDSDIETLSIEWSVELSFDDKQILDLLIGEI